MNLRHGFDAASGGDLHRIEPLLRRRRFGDRIFEVVERPEHVSIPGACAPEFNPVNIGRMTFSGVDLEPRSDRLVTTARALANETGSSAFTVAQVTERSELSLKAFYQCFRGKDELLLALLTEDSRIGADVLAQRIGNRRGEEAVHAYVIELFDMLSLPGAIGYAGVLVREYLRLVEHHQAELQVALQPLFDLLARNLSTPDPELDARTMFGVLLGGVHELVVGRARKPREVAEYLYRFCSRGVLGQ